MTEYFSELKSAKEIRIKLSKDKDENGSKVYSIIPREVEIKPANSKKKIIIFR